MADSAVAVTAGTGTNIDTRTEATSGNHRQVVVIGDPSLNAGIAPVDAQGLHVKQVTDAGTVIDPIAQVAHSAVDSGEPVKIGAKAITGISSQTAVSDDDRTDLFAGIDGVLITRPHCGLEDLVSGNASNTDGASTACITAQGAGVKTYLTAVMLTNTSAGNTFCEIKDGATTKLTIPVPANGGAIVPLPVPVAGTANTAWNFDAGAATTTMYCSMVGFKSAV